MAGAGDSAPSTNIQNLNPNLESLDAIINSDELTTITRETPENPTGKEILTIAGMAAAATTGNPAVAAAQQAIDAKNEAIDAKNEAQLYANEAELIVGQLNRARTVSTAPPTGIPADGEEWIVV